MKPHHQWLAQVDEPVLEPDLPIIDPHHHLWDGRSEFVEPRYLIDELVRDLSTGHQIVATVFIECGAMFKAGGPEPMRPIGETEFVAGIAAMSESGNYGPTHIARGIVGTANLRLGSAVGEVLDAQIAAGGGRFRGIRMSAAWHPSDAVPNHRTRPRAGLYLDPTFRQGFTELAPRRLTFEAWCYHTQLGELLDLARAFPETTIILDHFGGPIGIGPFAGKADEVFADWLAAITPLARCPNVVAKLGGLAMPVNGFGWHERDRPAGSDELVAANRRYYERTIELFGASRCMFESNFPVDKASVSYPVLWNAFKLMSAGCSVDERAALFHDTAARVYRL